METVKVECQSCGKSSKVKIFYNMLESYPYHKIEYPEDGTGNIISGRFRFDNQFGWECSCGKNSLLNDTEQRFWNNPASPPGDKEMKDIKENLTEDTDKFQLERV